MNKKDQKNTKKTVKTIKILPNTNYLPFKVCYYEEVEAMRKSGK